MAATLAAALLVGLLPATASAQVPLARFVALEVWEAVQFRGPAIDFAHPDPEKLRRRVADAGLLGRRPMIPETSPPSPFGEADLVVAEATSNVNMKVGTGPIRGEFQLLKHAPLVPTGVDSLADYVVTLHGHLSGMIDLSPALQGMPFAKVSGTWTMKGQKGGGKKTFLGVFLLPFAMPGSGEPVYLLPPLPADPVEAYVHGILFHEVCSVTYDFAGMTFCPVTPNETILDFPLTKVVILLFE